MENSGNKIKDIKIVAENVTKDFNRKPVFQNISFSLSSPSSLAITGKNGAGKSTLSKIISGLITPSRGSIKYLIENQVIDAEGFKHYVGFVSPYLNLYDEFTALENLQYLSRIRSSIIQNAERYRELLELVGLWQRRNDFVCTFSSGMKQRLKYAFALLHKPQVLILDEPTSNLDFDGVEFVKAVVAEQKNSGILIVATNDAKEADWCETKLHLDKKVS